MVSNTLLEDFDKCFANSVTKAVKGTELRFIGLDDLLAIKKKSKRLKDLLDFKNLQTLKEGKVPFDGSENDVFSLR